MKKKLPNSPVPLELIFDRAAIKRGLTILKAVDHPKRQRILKLVSGKSTIGVADLIKRTKLDSSVMSQHLSILKRAGLVNSVKDGRKRNYSLNQQLVVNVLDNLRHL